MFDVGVEEFPFRGCSNELWNEVRRDWVKVFIVVMEANANPSAFQETEGGNR